MHVFAEIRLAVGGLEMKKILAIAAMAAPLFVVAPVYAHHMADGIISDDIYDTIDENLEDSPHLELDLTTVGSGAATMSIVTITVDETDVDEVLEIIGDALTGQGTQEESSLDVDISVTGSDDLVTIVVMENIGQGESQAP
jgi:hypothetical protein